uniref:Uncharacterized protein n=1 Tax=Tanacetum cinerariifolium TaxID=118510 RepID=A0A699JRV6_TANCI|nr:hypothetical protein [Tanacetum cinerariifolium]
MEGDGAPPKEGIKSPSKLLSPEYQSDSSLGEPIRNSSSPKRVYFINTITIISKEDEPKEKLRGELSGSEMIIGKGESHDIKWDDPDNRSHGDTKGVDEVEEERDELEEEVEEEKEKDPKYFDTFPTVKE